MGAHLEGQWAQGTWTQLEEKHSSYKEFKAVARGISAFQSQLRGQLIQVRSDNTTSVAYLNKQGGTMSPILMSIAQEIFSWTEENLESLSAIHLEGVQNNLAIFLSRQLIAQEEWS